MINFSRLRLYTIFVATIVLLIIGSQIIIHWQLKRIDTDGELINDAGKLRMQSQMLVQLSLRLQDDPSIKQRLANELDNFKINQANVSSKIDQQLRQKEWKVISKSETLAINISEAVEELLNNPTNSVVVDLLLHKEKAFIDAQNATVKSIEIYNQAKIKKLSYIELWLSLITIIIILLEILYIFKPYDLNAQKDTDRIVRLLKEQLRLMRTVAHDLRNPISTIKTIHEMVKPDITFNDSSMEEMYDLIGYSTDQAEKTIQELLHKNNTDFKDIGNRALVDIDILIGKQIKAISAIESYKNRKIIKVNDTSVKLAVDEMKFTRVLQNLITNALKFSNREVSVSHYTKNGELIIEVIDKGIGIEATDIDDIFTDHEGKKGLNGEASFGLGLGIVKEIVEEYHGNVSVKSKPNEGSVFSIRMPLAAA